MKYIIANKFYSVSIFLYAVIIRAIFMFLSYIPFWDSETFYNNFNYLFWICCWCLLIMFLSEIIIRVTIIAIPIELILYKLKKITRNGIKLHPILQLMIWLAAALSLIYSYWFNTYCYPIIEQQLLLD